MTRFKIVMLLTLGSTIFLASCSNEDVVIPFEEIIDLKVLTSNGEVILNDIKADGKSLLLLRATIPPNAGDNFRQITFGKSGGVFQGASSNQAQVQVNSEGIADVFLEVPIQVGTLFISASVSNSTNRVENSVDLIRALPDFLIVEPESVNITIPASTNLNVFLFREDGMVSEGTQVDFMAFQLDNDNNEVEVGRFTGLANAKSDAEGKITVEFKTDTGDIDVSKNVFIRVSAINDTGDTVSEMIEISVQE